jgi:chromosome partitioning protein
VRLVAIMGATGGAGATTAVAHLASALAAQQRTALAIDFCPGNALRLHFGMAWAEEGGWARQLLDGQAWQAAAWRDSQGRLFLPFGALEEDAALPGLAQWLGERPGWFRERLGELQLAPDAVVVCDCLASPSPWRAQVLAAADLVLILCAPDTLSYAHATRLVDRARHHVAGSRPLPELAIVLNGFDPARRLDRDIALLLRTQYKPAFSPALVHRDESLREALACKQTVFDFAPRSQAAHDYAALATWTLARLGQIGRADPGQAPTRERQA